MKRMIRPALGALLIGAGLAMGGPVLAAPIVTCWDPGSTTGNDLTAANATTTINGGIYQSADSSGSVGTGDFPAFVKINGNATCIQGYNTDGALQFDTNNSPIIMFTLDTMNVVNKGGTDYVEFILDINQTKDNPLLSLDNVQVYVSNSSTATGMNPDTCTLTGATCVYDMDAGTNQAVLLNYTLNNGSGNGFDMSLFVPTTVFAGLTPSKTYVYLYSAFGAVGGNYAENDGPEEWAYNRCPAGTVCWKDPPPPSVPEPGTLALIGISLLSGVAVGRKRRMDRVA